MPELKVTGIAANILANCTVNEVIDSCIELNLETEQSAVFSEEIIPKLEQALTAYFEKTIAVQVTIGESKSETPAQMAQRLKKEEHEKMVENFEQDANCLLYTSFATGRYTDDLYG